MKNLSLILVSCTILFTTVVHAKVASAIKGNRLTCAHTKYPLTVVADLKAGEVKLIDNVNVTVETLIIETVRRTNNKIELLNSKRQDLPELFFSAELDSNGFGMGISFDDTSGGSSNYKCTLVE